MKAFGLSDKGSVREENQDSFAVQLVDNSTAVLVLCDGMGGARGGKHASNTASEAFLRRTLETLERVSDRESSLILRESAAYANLKVYDLSVRESAFRGMGTTLVAALIQGEDAAVVNIGDSRCYWLAEGQLQQVTRDHSLVQQLLEEGALTEVEARSHPRRNVITRAVGTEHSVRSDIFRVELQPEDVLLLCSDGLSNLVTEDELRDILLAETEPEAACCALVALALERGAPDNVTAVVCRR